MTQRSLFILASAAGVSAVALGAFGAHALKPMLLETGRYETWSTATHYHLVHAVALLALAMWGEKRSERAAFRITAALWTIGILLFSGSLYLLCTGAPKLFAYITPVGGVFFIVGWIAIGVTAMRDDNTNQAPKL